jgi:thioredoxin 1
MSASSPHTQPWSVYCLCAAWCGTCKEYAPLFESLGASFPDIAFHWIDVEDEADVVDPLEIDNFPSILISHGSEACFFGVVLPHLETLKRLIQAQLDAAQDPEAVRRNRARVAPEAQSLAQRLARHIT